ncbi:FAD-dependent monooxygenase [Granulicoccus phenolivorans]|uniref:FAD-dependent monooxygenase n=1 Tax=Granulicoccus phenolivorans TaxID=266854 RepID=UPI000426ACA4|nr:FAD-dependent monooxygenase [Granulicoccus phenolivorans]
MQGHATIIGAGIAGLATAIALRRTGWTVTIRERALAISAGGNALGMWPAAMTALDALDLGDRVRAHAVYAAGERILTPEGALQSHIPPSRHVYLISRRRLLEVLYDAVPEGLIAWGTPLRPGEDLPPGDIIVGADGIHSVVRERHWGTTTERSLGTVALRGDISGEVSGVTETWGRGAMFGVTPTSDRRTNWFACVRPGVLTATGDGVAADLREHFGTWHPAVSAVVHRITDQDVDARDLFDVRHRGSYAKGRVVLIGDAAHAMAPDLGRGACEALVDALTLAEQLSGADTPAPALRQFDHLRRHRTQRYVAISRMLNRLSTGTRGIHVRTALLALLPSAGSAAQRTEPVRS